MLKWLFKIPPTIGSKWIEPDRINNPFINKSLEIRTVVEIKNGFVRYEIDNISYSIGIRDLRLCFREIK